MPNFYRRCHACRNTDPTTSWREDQVAVLCISCYLDARAGHAHALPSTMPHDVAPLAAPMSDVVHFSPAALAAMLHS